MNLAEYIDPNMVALIQTGGYFVMFGLMFLEGPIVTIASAFLASLGFFNIYIVALLGWLGDFVWDVAFFMIGKYGLGIFKKKTAIDTPEEESFIGRIDGLIKSNLLLSVIAIKLTPYAPLFAFPYMGRSGVSLKRFAIASAITSIPVPVCVAIIGYKIGYIEKLINSYSTEALIGYIASIIAIVALIGGTGWYFWKKYRGTLSEYIPKKQTKMQSSKK